jgi:hypothetical protein
MKCLWGLIFLFFTSCAPTIIYSDHSVEFFLDKWWALGENDFFTDDVCFFLDSSNGEVWVHYLEDEPYIAGSWLLEDEENILLEDIYGYDISIWPYGTCDDYNVVASSGIVTQQTKLYKCDF